MLERIRLELEKLASCGRLKSLVPTEERAGAKIQAFGKKLVDFTNWDYLDLSSNNRFKFSLQSAVERFGLSARSSRLLTGSTLAHSSCEKRLAAYFGSESSIILPSKNQAVFSLLISVLREGDLLLVDELSQSPASDAAYLVNASVKSFRHFNAEDAHEILSQSASTEKIIFVESLSPVTGRFMNLMRLREVALKHNAFLIVDESFAAGVIGSRGSGLLEQMGGRLEQGAVVVDLSLGLGTQGGAIISHREIISNLINHSKSLFAETAISPAIAAAAETAIEIVELLPTERGKIAASSTRLKEGLESLGCHVSSDIGSPVVSVEMKSLKAGLEMQLCLRNKGFLADVIPYPTYREHKCALRFIINRLLDDKLTGQLLGAISEVIRGFSN